jgi:hypothetical protein
LQPIVRIYYYIYYYIYMIKNNNYNSTDTAKDSTIQIKGSCMWIEAVEWRCIDIHESPLVPSTMS